MTFAKSSILGFSVGFVAAVAFSRVRVPRPAFLISVDRKERLDKKEAMAKINDALEDRALLFDMWLSPGGDDPDGLLDTMRLKAMTDPQWKQLLLKFETFKKDVE